MVAEIPPEWLPFHNAELIVGSFSLIANAVLLYLIVFKTPPELKEYQPFVFMITLADFIFEIYVIFLIRPVMIFPALAAVITGPLQVFGQKAVFYLSMLGIFVFIYSMLAINLAFVYRYVCVAHKRFYRFFVRKRTLIFINLALIGLGLGSLIYPTTQEEDHKIMIMLVESLMPTLKDHVDEFVIVAVKGANLWINVNVLGMLMPTCILNAILAVLIVRKLRSFRSTFSATTYKMHLRLAACLSCQTFFPIILTACPVIAAFYFYLTEGWQAPKNLRYVASMFIFTISCHPLVNAMCTLFFMQPYRRQIIKDRWIRYVMTKFCGKHYSNTITLAPVSRSMEMRDRISRKSSVHPMTEQTRRDTIQIPIFKLTQYK